METSSKAESVSGLVTEFLTSTTTNFVESASQTEATSPAIAFQSTEKHFSAINYAAFGCMLALSAFIGIYFGFISKKKQNNTVEYLLGGKTMNFFPIAASLISSHISGATFLAVPAEVYAFGSEYVLSVICALLVSFDAG